LIINDARQTLSWFVEDVWGHFDDDHTRPGVPLFPSERRNADGTAARVGDEALRASLVDAAARHLPDWPDRVTPHVLRHFCASELYRHGMASSPSRRPSATPGSPPPWATSTCTAPTSKRRGWPASNVPRTD